MGAGVDRSRIISRTRARPTAADPSPDGRLPHAATARHRPRSKNAPIAIIVSVLAIRELRRKRHLHGMGRAVFGLIMGIVFTGVVVIGFVVVGMSGRR